MHLWIIAITLVFASGLRVILWAMVQRTMAHRDSISWRQRWQHTLSAFLVSPLLLLMTAAVMIQMGTDGTMLGISVGAVGFVIGVGSLGVAGLMLGYLGIQAGRSLRRIETLPSVTVPGTTQEARLLESSTPFAGQVGVWQSELVVSQGLLATLTPDQLTAVLAHEAAHAAYRDTFWFFLLGWVRVLTCWLPRTRVLWQELLLLREVRADWHAAQTVDPLVLAEALLEIVRSPEPEPLPNCAAFSPPSAAHRLEERVNALLDPMDDVRDGAVWVWASICFILLPLVAIALHH